MENTLQSNLQSLQRSLQTTLNAVLAAANAVDDDWSLNGDQAFFMLSHHNLIEAAFAGEADENEYTKILRETIASDEYTTLFGEMSFDEAYDRYNSMLEEGRA